MEFSHPMPTPRPTLIGLPYDAGSSFLTGARLAPPVIRQALHSPSGNAWSESLIDTSSPGVLDDAGDLPLERDETARPAIEAAIRRLVAEGRTPIALGGDHSVTFPILSALRPAWPTLSILHIDAHPDLYEEFEGQRFSHACPFARIMEQGLADSLTQVGIRALTGHQREQAERFGVEIIDMRAWTRGSRPVLHGPLYVSIDLDALDPAFAPGVSHPEPGGLSMREVLDILQTMPGPIAGADIVELNPSLDPMGLTARVAAKTVKELVSRILESAPGFGLPSE
jgi:arginase